MRKNTGFTLIELMIVVALIAILAAIAYPNYTNSVRKGNRTEAQGMLSLAAANMEKRRAQTLTYVGATAGTDFPAQSPQTGVAKYLLDFPTTSTNPTAGTYIIRATSTDQQDGDTTKKEVLMINQLGQRCVVTNAGGTPCTFGTDPSW